MKLLVTGATGFLGTAVVGEALRRGHSVIALARRGISTGSVSESNPSLRRVEIDLADTSRVIEALRGIDAVIHLAASKSGSAEKQMADTVQATQSLLSSMKAAKVDRIIGVSSFSVYDYQRLRDGDVLDEQSPLEANPNSRDLYSKTKRMQEELIRNEPDLRWTILRPGAIYGPANTWTARLGASIGNRFWIRIGSSAQLPLTYVENCAQAIVLAAENDSASGEILNVIDDNPPAQSQYARALRKRMRPKPKAIVIPWPVMQLIGRCATTTNKIILRGRAKLPSILIPSRLAARFKPLRFDNRQIKQMLNWQPRYNLAAGLDRSFEPAASAHSDMMEKSAGRNRVHDGPTMIHYIGIDGIGSAWVAIELHVLEQRGIPFELHALRPPLSDLFSAQWAIDLNRRTRRIYPPAILKIAMSALLGPFLFGRRFFAAAFNAVTGERETLRARAAVIAHFLIACDWARKLRNESVSRVHAQWAHTGATIGMYGAWLLNVRFSFTGHAADLFRDRIALKDKIRRAEFIVAISNFHREFYLKNGARPEQLHLVFCGIDLEQFPMRAQLRRTSRPRIVSVGRLVEKKGFHILVDACKLLKDRGANFECVIAGNGPMEAELKRQVASLALEECVNVTGKIVLQEDLPQFLAESDIFAQPCVWSKDNDVDGTPRTLMEAMACGVPSISTRLVGIPDILVDGQSGLLVDPNNAGQLADAIEKLMNDPDLAWRLAVGGREQIDKHFNLQTCLDPLVSLFMAKDEMSVEQSASERALHSKREQVVA